jgi:hypothetical protein
MTMTPERRLGVMQTSRIVSTTPSYLAVTVKHGLIESDHAKTLDMTAAWKLFQMVVKDPEVSVALLAFREKTPPQGHGGVFSIVPEVDAALSEFSKERLCALRARLFSNPAV